MHLAQLFSNSPSILIDNLGYHILGGNPVDRTNGITVKRNLTIPSQQPPTIAENDGRNYWTQTMKGSYFQPNVLPFGAVNLEGQEIGFIQYENTFQPGSIVTFSATLSMVVVQKMVYARVEPTRIKCIGIGPVRDSMNECERIDF